MITPKQLTNGFELNTRLIELQTKDLCHADSLIQTPYNINSLNWVLGHLAVNRDRVLALLGEMPLLTNEETSRYKRGSEPIQQKEPSIIPLERLLEIIHRGQGQISEALNRLTHEELALVIEGEGEETTLGDRLFGLYFHDTYHTGQTDLLRQISGKNDQVIP